MTIIVNNTRIRIFKGATVGDVLLRYAVRNMMDLTIVDNIIVNDKWGHLLDHAAPLHDNQKIIIKKRVI